jgi:hypothetical protein
MKIKKLEELLEELERYIPQHELMNQQVSTASVGWHIAHILVTLNVIIDAVQKSDPKAYSWTLNFKRVFVFTMNKIPRGRVKAPRVVQPTIDINKDTLESNLEHSKHRLRLLEELSLNHYFKHPFLGNMNVKPTIKFLQLHTQHHVHIIKDILRAKDAE